MDCVDDVDPFIGVDGNGNCLCGPYLPLSLVRLGPDTEIPQPTHGYRSRDPIIGFSHTHVSGTGGEGRYGNIRVTPFVGPPRPDPQTYQRKTERAAAGYYGVTLLPEGIEVELTSTPRVGVHRYGFPEKEIGNLLIDAGAVVQMGLRDGVIRGGVSTGGFVEWISGTELVGRGDYKGGWGHPFPYSVYFYARFDQPVSRRSVVRDQEFIDGTWGDGPNSKAIATFSTPNVIELQVGISFVSVANARASVDRESAGKSFDGLRANAREIWDASLSRIKVEGGSREQRTLFYTLFTRLLCMPGDLGIDDEFPNWHSGVRHFSDYYCLWDSVRNANSLISLFDPDLEVAMLNCLLDVADHTGWLPDAWIAGHSAQVQGGSSADILFCEAALKGLPGIDYEKALRQMRKNCEVESPDPRLYGRHLPGWRDRGFVPSDVLNCVSRHLEYSYQDWCIGTLANKLEKRDVAHRYFASARQIWNLWDEDLKCFAPKTPEGNWAAPFDPASCRPDSWNDPYFYEGCSRQWSFNAHHDFAGLVARHGGCGGFVKHLDEFFESADRERPEELEAGLQRWDRYDSKETMLHIPYLYLYAGRPDKTAERVRWAMRKYFDTSRAGLSDNEDMGCQSAFYMCSALGIYPVMGQDLYWLTTPAFTRSEIALGQSGRSLIIEAPKAGHTMAYVQSASLNGKNLNRAWICHAEIAGGATLHFELSAEPTDWATSCPPPSPAGKISPCPS